MILKTNCLYNYSLKQHCTFKVGGEAQKTYIPENEEEFIEILENETSIPTIIGGGSNTIISSAGINGTVILTEKLNQVTSNNGLINAQCGVKTPFISKIAADEGFGCMEFLIGIPGTIGGAVAMNASAHKQSINNIITKAYVYDVEKKEKMTLSKDELDMSYRETVFTKNPNLILLNADFELYPKDIEKIKALMQFHLEYRKQHHPPLTQPNAGSTFRNPAEGVYVGKMFEELGARNWRVGGMKVSDLHTNFLINYNNATSKDILNLMLKMYNEVKNNYGYELIPEVKYVGNNDMEEAEIWKILKH